MFDNQKRWHGSKDRKGVKSLKLLIATFGGLVGVVCLSLVSTAPAFAASTKPSEPIEFPHWAVTSVSSPYWSAGPWNDGPEGAGPASLGFSQSIGVSNTASGNIQVADSVLSAAVGYSVTHSYSATSDYSVTVPAGTTYQILWRNWYQKKTVKQEEFAPPSYSQVVATATCYTEQWNHFGYTWENLG